MSLGTRTPFVSRAELLCRAALAAVFFLSSISKMASMDLVTADLSYLGIGSSHVLAIGLVVIELLTALALVRWPVPGLALSALLIGAFTILAVVRWDYTAIGCSCFGALGLGIGGHQTLLAFMLLLGGIAASLRTATRLRYGCLAACLALAVVAYGAVGYGFMDTVSLTVARMEDERQVPFELALDTAPVLVVSWDCPDCRRLLRDLHTRLVRGTPLAVVFTYSEWLDPTMARQTALAKASQFGLCDDPDIHLFLDKGFQVEAVPTLLVRYPGSSVSRRVMSPSIAGLDKVLERFPADQGP
jgi:hypothetical protein